MVNEVHDSFPLYDYAEDGGYDFNADPLGVYVEADPHDAFMTLASPEGTGDGRSGFMWIRLRNGDLILGVFPEGDTYFKYEEKYP